MKSKYSIVIEKEEKEHFKEVLNTINVTGKLKSSNAETVVYHVDLSKYEFLSLRLLCKVGKIKALTETIEVI